MSENHVDSTTLAVSIDDTTLINGVIINLATTFIVFLLTLAVSKYKGISLKIILNTQYGGIKSAMYYSLFLLIVSLYVFYIKLISLNTFLIIAVFYLSILTLFLFYYAYKLSAVGISGCDKFVSKGLDYNQCLKDSVKSFKFLGVGASKLTSEDEFNRMLSRCESKGVELILLDPLSTQFNKMERIANTKDNRVVDGDYVKNVYESLKVIHKKMSYGVKINLWFYNLDDYSDFLPFRLVFVNDDLCLVSFAKAGVGNEGKLIPQLHIKDSHIDSNNTIPTFYYAFYEYYKNIKEHSNKVTTDTLKTKISEVRELLGDKSGD